MQAALYRIAMTAMAALVLARLWARGDRAALAARLGRGPGPGGSGPHLWLHAASNGELASARPVLEALRRARPGLALVITCNSASGVTLAREMGYPAALAPLDLPGPTDRFTGAWHVSAHVAMEAELWPVRFARLPGPVAVLGARMSQGTARGWSRLPRLAARTLGHVRYLSAQDRDSLARLLALGLPPAAAGPVADLKAFYAPPPAQQPGPDFAAAYPRAATWLAASTHPGEEAVVIAAHLAARAARPGLRLILAPRHPDRGDAIARDLRAAGLEVARRSAGDPPGAEVYLADTLGEMPLWYALAGTVFVGGTLTDRGGHTPFEPARFGAALIHGPDTRNFRAPFEALHRAGAATRIDGAPALAAALTALADPATQQAAGRAAAQALTPGADLEALVEGLARVVAPPPRAERDTVTAP